MLTEQSDLSTGDLIYGDNMENTPKESQIQNLFKGSIVLLTGGTGFLGKLLVEKLLRSCPDIKKIYLITRPKKNKEIVKRLQEQFDDQLYDNLRKVLPDFIEKIGIIEGDVGKIGLGISEEDRAKLTKEVEFIFHGAATVRFVEELKTAVEINVRGTRDMLHLARSCTKLRAYVHISTAYSNCPLNEIDEKFYDASLVGDKLIDLVENLDMKILNSITPGLLGDLPNTYVYTKLAAEDIVKKHSKGLPVAVIRPSSVIGTAKEPLQGWIDNVYGPTGVRFDFDFTDKVVKSDVAAGYKVILFIQTSHTNIPEVVLGVGIGLLRVQFSDPNVLLDLVPGDLVVNACIAVAWKTARDYLLNCEDAPKGQLPPIYNFGSSEQAPLLTDSFRNYIIKHGKKIPTKLAMWHFMIILTPSKFWYSFYCFFLHWVPAYIVDAILIIIGKKPMLRKAYKKIDQFSTALGYFALRTWRFRNKNTQNLHNELCETDKDIFYFDMGSIDWDEYFRDFIRGVRMYILKDPLDTVPQSKRKYFKLKVLHYFCVGLICFGLLKLLNFLVRKVVGL